MLVIFLVFSYFLILSERITKSKSCVLEKIILKYVSWFLLCLKRSNSCSASTGANQERQHFALRSIRRYHCLNSLHPKGYKPSPAADIPKTWQHLRFIPLCLVTSLVTNPNFPPLSFKISLLSIPLTRPNLASLIKCIQSLQRTPNHLLESCFSLFSKRGQNIKPVLLEGHIQLKDHREREISKHPVIFIHSFS